MMHTPPTLMLVGVHHDDNEGLAGGLICRHRKAGWRVVSVVMTNGRFSRGTFSEEHIEVRNRESLEAAKVLDMETVFLGFREAGFRATPEACDALVEQILRYRPKVIVTHPPRDYHFDHMSTSQCVLEATHLCPLAGVADLPLPRLYYCDAVHMPFEPDVYVDISDFVETKSRAQACHASQFPKEGAGAPTIIDLALAKARCRGIESGVRHAEAFRFVPKLAQARMAELLE